MFQFNKLIVDYSGFVYDNFDESKLQTLRYDSKYTGKIHCLFLNNFSVYKFTDEGWVHKKTKDNFNYYDIKKKNIIQINVKTHSLKMFKSTPNEHKLYQKNESKYGDLPYKNFEYCKQCGSKHEKNNCHDGFCSSNSDDYNNSDNTNKCNSDNTSKCDSDNTSKCDSDNTSKCGKLSCNSCDNFDPCEHNKTSIRPVNIFHDGIAVCKFSDLDNLTSDCVDYALLINSSTILQKNNGNWNFIDSPSRFYFYDLYKNNMWKIDRCQNGKAIKIKCCNEYFLNINTRIIYYCENKKWFSIGPNQTKSNFEVYYSSGQPITITASSLGSANTASAIGFGNSVSNIIINGTNIDMSNISNLASYPASSRTITNISALLVVSDELNLATNSMTIVGQVYTSTNNTFSPLAGALVTFPTITGLITTGTILNAVTNNLNISIPLGRRVLLVFTCTTTGSNSLTTFSGYASAGISQF